MNVNIYRIKIICAFLAAATACSVPRAVAADSVAAQTTTSQSTNPIPVSTITNSPVEQEYEALIAKDDEAHDQVDGWIEENNRAKAKGKAVPDVELNQRILLRLAPVRKAYEEFLEKHPDHVRAHLAFGGFLNEANEETAGEAQWEKALALDTNNPASYNNLAGRYAETDREEKAFQYYEKAIELRPQEALYYENFADALYVARKKAMEYYKLDEQQVFSKALAMYSNAVRLDPSKFVYASRLADTYYAVKPFPPEKALQAWTNALKIAKTDLEREGVAVHLARCKMLGGQLADARAQINAVTNPVFSEIKTQVLKHIAEREKPAETNQPAPVSTQPKAQPSPP
jgi:tetratricopeptide (TPR) repeat protein